MSKLLEYLNTLDKDSAALAAHRSDPNAAMADFGLTPEEQTAVLSGDKEAVAGLLGISAEDLPALDSIEY
ncbi:hypothetical protein H8L32_15930 [Undibacterium sp. CY18W]|uniref:Extradiol ring-cleavage dioxygenase LigAB LigA subunit domain-containing protein n=1 Tax=Undibacterium hunanense TaxID=2762292 RepID=A0ABR6ZSX1_9BURK|nr:hypothetical protein [Undibacterium hunanense]MBC3918981.1 hypothetical protein [Undibacterium hunanense]